MERSNRTESEPGDSPNMLDRIQRAKTELEHMIDMNPQIMLLADAQRLVLRANLALLSLLGKTSFADVLGHAVDSLFDCGDAQFLPRLLARRDAVSTGETLVSLPNRAPHTLRFTVVAGREGPTVCVLLIEDVTEEKEYAEERRRFHRREAIRELVGALMHTINQHLTVINVRVRLMSMAIDGGTASPESLKENLADITDLTLKIANTLAQVNRPMDFATTPYIGGTDILDLAEPPSGGDGV